MALELLPVTEADTARIHEIIFEAFESDPLHILMFPREHASNYKEYMHESLRSKLRDPTTTSLKVVDKTLTGDASIIGYARWKFPIDQDQSQQQTPTSQENQTSEEEKPKSPNVPFPAHANKQLMDFFGSQITKLRGQFVDPSRDFVLDFLATDPKHQGRGVGKVMLKYGLDELDRRGNEAKAYLESTAAGMPVYKKIGFAPLGSIDIPLAEFGIEDGGVYSSIVMGRDAQKVE
ncbi:GNAT family N-acetyltransferase [Aspergillus affinis]|uniref:GNAT family N-acetyltransferase n=1 Tax=Aspergillus affinis TaxID=1070780 RepID=UPI0022FF0504|nr:acyl-CoA N-acyltransferase [Aspergillus affinis]KAI9036171.1 acyl-CoA N-acyltransferase [Aspergillus affinis]